MHPGLSLGPERNVAYMWRCQECSSVGVKGARAPYRYWMIAGNGRIRGGFRKRRFSCMIIHGLDGSFFPRFSRLQRGAYGGACVAVHGVLKCPREGMNMNRRKRGNAQRKTEISSVHFRFYVMAPPWYEDYFAMRLARLGWHYLGLDDWTTLHDLAGLTTTCIHFFKLAWMLDHEKLAQSICCNVPTVEHGSLDNHLPRSRYERPD